eukprot:363905_1
MCFTLCIWFLRVIGCNSYVDITTQLSNRSDTINISGANQIKSTAVISNSLPFIPISDKMLYQCQNPSQDVCCIINKKKYESLINPHAFSSYIYYNGLYINLLFPSIKP